MSNPAATQPAAAPDSTHPAWYVVATLSALTVARKALDLWSFRARAMERVYQRLEDQMGKRIEELETRIRTLEQALRTVTGERDAARAELAKRDGAK